MIFTKNFSWRQFLLWLSIGGLIILVDQITKLLVIQNLHFGEIKPVISSRSGYLNLILIGNPGAAFSFLANAGGWQRWFLTGFALLSSVFILFLIARNLANKTLCISLVLIFAGAIGNSIDRLRFGYVIDFIDFYIKNWHWPAFNVADSAITIAIIWMALNHRKI